MRAAEQAVALPDEELVSIPRVSAPAPALVNIAIIGSHYGKQRVHAARGEEEAADLLQDQEHPKPLSSCWIHGVKIKNKNKKK